MENNKNLLTKLATSLKVKFKNSKVVKKIAALAMAGCIALAPFAIGCNNTTGNNGNTPGGGGNNPPTSQYSQLLQNVLNDEYYNSLIAEFRQNHTVQDSAYFNSNPYGFLEDEGFNISDIKTDKLICKTYSFVLDAEPNNLYIATYVETKATTPYYTEYMLKYTLTDKEMEDYSMVHSSKYFQAMFMNDEISQTKTPEIISETRVTIEAHNNLLDNLYDKAAIKTALQQNKGYDIIVKDFSKANDIFNVYIFSNDNNKFTSVQTLAIVPLTSSFELIASDSNGAFYKPCKWGDFRYHTNFDSATAGKSISIFTTDDYAFNGISNLKK